MFSVRLLSAVQDLAVAKVASAYSFCLILVNHCNEIGNIYDDERTI